MTAPREGATARPTMCFIDTMRPVTPAETAASRFYLGLHRDHWRAARIVFRQVCAGIPANNALIAFVATAGPIEPETVEGMEAVLSAISREMTS